MGGSVLLGEASLFLLLVLLIPSYFFVMMVFFSLAVNEYGFSMWISISVVWKTCASRSARLMSLVIATFEVFSTVVSVIIYLRLSVSSVGPIHTFL